MATERWRTLATEPHFGTSLGVVEIVTHDRKRCQGRACVVHAPSGHHMADWPTVFRADRGITERLCPHGVGHPDPDDLAYRKSVAKWVVEGDDGTVYAVCRNKRIAQAAMDGIEYSITLKVSSTFDESVHGCDGCCDPEHREEQE